jgi:ribose transport system permease protein
MTNKLNMKISGILKKAGQFLIEYNTLVIFLVMVLISSLFSDVFFSHTNITNLLRQVSGIGIISMGMLLVILTGGIDLSVGSVVALTSVLCGYFLQFMPLPVALACSVIAGIVVGSFSGYLVSVHRMAPFIATLAAMTIARGAGFIISKGSPIIIESSGSGLTSFGTGSILGIPYPVFLIFAIFFLVFFILKYTVFGRLIIAIGSNEEAVRLSGIKLKRYKFAVYGITGGFAALAGIISTSRTGVGSPIIGVGLELDVIAAVVIGGASLSGGKGTALNTMLGVLILGIIGNLMNLQNVPAYPQQVIKGLIIIAAVLMQGYKSRTS